MLKHNVAFEELVEIGAAFEAIAAPGFIGEFTLYPAVFDVLDGITVRWR